MHRRLEYVLLGLCGAVIHVFEIDLSCYKCLGLRTCCNGILDELVGEKRD